MTEYGSDPNTPFLGSERDSNEHQQRLLSVSSQRQSSVSQRRSSMSRRSSVEYCDMSGVATIIPEGTEERKSSISKLVEIGWWEWWSSGWTEDGTGLTVALLIFVFTTVFAICHQNIDNYSESVQWPLGIIGLGAFIVTTTHRMLGKKQALEAYAAIFAIAVAARSIGMYEPLKNSGLSSSFWAIILGVLLRACGLASPKVVVSGEYFIKIGIVLMVMNFGSIASVGLRGLVVAWLDTAIVVATGVCIAMYFFSMNLKDSLVVAGASSICGSSAATAISAAVHEGEGMDDSGVPKEDHVCSTIIALMGLLNTPIMPLMPMVHEMLNVNPVVVGAWIGGSIDSTGQVIASASLGGDAVLEPATVIKMTQNVLIGPVVLLLTIYFQKTFRPSILLEKFPLFVVGFFITSILAVLLRVGGGLDSEAVDLVRENSWFMSEWVNLIGFARIGLQIDISNFLKNSQNHSILGLYLLIQSVDLMTTFGWSYLMFHNASYDDDDIDN